MLISLRNRSVRGRLLSLVALIVLPLTAIGSYLAYDNNRLIASNMTEARVRLSEDFAFRSRLWFRGMLRAAEVLAVTVETGSGQDWRHAYCQGDGRSLLAAPGPFQALVVHGLDGDACHVLNTAVVNAAPFVVASNQTLALPSLQSWGTQLTHGFRYSSVQIGGVAYGIVQHRTLTTNAPVQAISLFFPMEQLDAVFNINKNAEEHIVALVQNAGLEVLASRGIRGGDLTWLPAHAAFSGLETVWSGPSRDGRQLTYVAREVVPGELTVLAAFSERAMQQAQVQLTLLAGTPMALLLLFMLAYWQLVNRDIGRSIDSIELAARRAANGDFEARANVDDAMPLELRRAGEGINKIIDAAERRNSELTEAAKRNADLMRELHHRVKNSLQVVQSYLAITRRTLPNRESETLREAEA
ncbi:MAG: histidine kinase dimerization/phosphoacceptor domain -containing protein, partial [Bosea sp. (in: a-proteobacteria)]